MPQNASKCVKMPQNASKCLKMFEWNDTPLSKTHTHTQKNKTKFKTDMSCKNSTPRNSATCILNSEFESVDS